MASMCSGALRLFVAGAADTMLRLSRLYCFFGTNEPHAASPPVEMGYWPRLHTHLSVLGSVVPGHPRGTPHRALAARSLRRRPGRAGGVDPAYLPGGARPASGYVWPRMLLDCRDRVDDVRRRQRTDDGS